MRLKLLKNLRFTQALLMSAMIPVLCLSAYSETLPSADADILNVQLEDLLNIQVTSVSKKKESLSKVASAAFVISNDDLKRSGVTNIADALRMAPGVQVAKIDSNKWAVTSRGFNGRFANKLLVMIDGRSVYSSWFSGVYWDMQDIMLEDIERIEVIRGPGGTIWGANAVNGVINIISKHTADTQAAIVSAGAGNYEKTFASARIGGKINENAYGRLFIRANQRDQFVDPAGSESEDDWDAYRIGGKMDFRFGSTDSMSLSGEHYRGDINQQIVYAVYTAPYQNTLQDDADFSGVNLLARWDHSASVNSDWSLQFYYDQTQRNEFMLENKNNTYDIDFTQRLVFVDNNHLVWGLGYRFIEDELKSTPVITIEPESRSSELLSAFAQAEFMLLSDQLALTIGSKIEHNSFTGDEVQPSVKLNWTVNPSTQLWGAISKAVRTPSLAERDVEAFGQTLPPPCSAPPAPACPPGSTLPIAVTSIGSADFDSEELLAYEIGMRLIPSTGVSLDIALFYNDYSKLRSFQLADPVIAFSPVPHLASNVSFVNKASGQTKGAELALGWKPAQKLSFDLAYSFIETDITWTLPTEQNQNTPAPQHQLSLRSGYDYSQNVNLDFWLRYVDSNTVVQLNKIQEVDAYTTLDIRLSWRLSPSVGVSLVGQNLLENRHAEYIQEAFIEPAEVERSYYVKVELQF